MRLNTIKVPVGYIENSFKAVPTSLKEAVSKQYFIVGSLNPQQNIVSFAVRPVIHDSSAKAETEARRLAVQYPGKHFIYVQFQGGFHVPSQPSVEAF